MSRFPRSHRRNFLLFGGASALAATAVANNVTPSSILKDINREHQSCRLSMADNYCLRDFALEDFQVLLGETFKVAAFPFSTSLQLHAVTSHLRSNDKRPSKSRNEPFSLHFIGKNKTTLRSEIQDLHHPRIGSFKVFINQIGHTGSSDEKHYEVVFG